ncbi:membrane dipeptidase [Flavobacterium sp.]|uniref:dipeptidase n=1 Tax=Flavobacterium sp. TaxID=239 RepID=UPI001217CBFA|nr:membrane dipeptidase [Flavobacterium sp.]RZJ71768.1 MAG: peptidase M19 [Flavobacterium sp.]
MENRNPEFSRRKFVKILGSSGAMLVLNPYFSWTLNEQEIDPRVIEIVKRTIGIDTHNHVDVPLVTSQLPGPKVDLAGEMKKSGLSAIAMTFAVDYQKLTKEGEAYERFLNGLSAVDAILKANGMKRALNLRDIEKAHKSQKPTVIQSVEGGHFLEGKIERLQVAYDRGLRHLGLLHDNDASVVLGDIYTNPVKREGLTQFGSDVIRESEKLGILIDLAHCDDDTVNAALKVAKNPVLISHTGLDTRLGQNENFAKMMKPRLIAKEQAKIVADKGGVIGVWTHLAENPTVFADNVRAMVDVVGVEHVSIGTDTKMTPAYHAPDSNFKNQGERAGERTNSAWEKSNGGFYYTVVEALLKAGFNEPEIAKIGGGNYCRLFDAATK